MADLKIRLRLAETEIFYYPDVSVVCDPRDKDHFFAQYPRVIVEVLSPDTERIDRREKFLSYTQIETVEEYVLVAQDKPQVTVFRRSAGWQPDIVSRPQDELRLASIDFRLPLGMVYEGVSLSDQG